MDAAPPPPDPRPDLWHLDRARRVAAILAVPLLAIAGAFAWFGWNDAWLYGQDRVRHAQADVVARWFVPEPDRWWVRYTFVDGAGASHTIEHSLDAPPGHDVGDRIDIVHWSSRFDGEVQMDVVSRDDVIVKRIFYGMALFVGGTAIGLLVFDLRRQGWRRRLLRQADRIAGAQPTLQRRRLPLGGGVEQWRLLMRHYDPESSSWREARSDWYPAPAPELTADTPLPPILVDPQRPRRTWIAAAALAPPSR